MLFILGASQSSSPLFQFRPDMIKQLETAVQPHSHATTLIRTFRQNNTRHQHLFARCIIQCPLHRPPTRILSSARTCSNSSRRQMHALRTIPCGYQPPVSFESADPDTPSPLPCFQFRPDMIKELETAVTKICNEKQPFERVVITKQVLFYYTTKCTLLDY